MLYFGVFDGHRGALASEFMKERLHQHVLYHLKNDGDKNLERVLSKAFLSANNAFAKYVAGKRNAGQSSHRRVLFASSSIVSYLSFFALRPSMRRRTRGRDNSDRGIVAQQRAVSSGSRGG